MRTRSNEVYRRWAYIFFGVTLLAFLGGLIPGMYTGNLVATGISSTLVLVSAVVSLLMGRIGFREEAKPGTAPSAAASKEATSPPTDIHYIPLDPDQITFDDTNWLYTRGGHVHDKHPSHRSR